MGLRARLLLLVALPLVPALVLALFTNIEQRRLGAFKVEKDAIRVGQLAAAAQLGLIEATRQHLQGLARLPQARGSNFGEYARFFTNMIDIYAEYNDLGLVEINGDVVARSFSYKVRTNLAHRADFQRVLKTQNFTIGDYQAGDSTHAPSLWFAHPVFDEKGRFVRVLYAALTLEAVDKVALKVELPAGGVISIFDKTGHVLAHSPEGKTWVGRSCADLPYVHTIMSRIEGTAEMPGLDDVSRLYAFSPIRNGPEAGLFVSVGIPLAFAYADISQALVRNLIILLLVAVGALTAAYLYANSYILRPIQLLSSTTSQVATGDLGARTGIVSQSGELNRLAKAFDNMTGSLQRQQKQALDARKNIEELNAKLEQRVRERTYALEQANQELEAFSYSVSHDLRAPLRRIRGFVQILEEDLQSILTESTRDHMSKVTAAAVQMGELIENLLSFCKLGAVEMLVQEVNMSVLVKEAIRELEPDLKQRRIEWQIADLPDVYGDGATLKQVWVNLLSNAIKYTRECPRAEIRLGCERSQDEVEFWVRDNGAGFDMDYADKLFCVFQRLHSADKFEGHGIGLALVRRIIARHGGRTWAEGKLDSGATFHFTLPAGQRENPS